MENKEKSFNKNWGTKNMTEGKPWERLVEFAVPLLLGNLIQQLYNTVDSIIVGRYIGDDALAAIGATMSLIFFVIVLFIGISVGAGILVSQYFGAKDKELLSRTVGNSIGLNLIISVFVMISGSLLSDPFLGLLNTPPEVFEMAKSYFVIICIGIVGMSYYNILSGLLRGLGDSVMPLIYLCISAVLNIGLDLLFVAVFKMGISGAAFATVISQAVSALLCFFRLSKMTHVLVLDKKAFKFDPHIIAQLVKLGLPVGIAQGIVSVSALAVQRLTNSFGTTIVAVTTVVMRVDGFVMLPNFSFGNAMSTFTGQNAGAMMKERIRQGTKDGLKIGISVSAGLVVLILIFGKFIMGFFTNTEEVINLSYEMMCILGIGYIAFAVTQILSGTMRGAGDTHSSMWISILSTVILRVPSAYLLAHLTKSELHPKGDPRSIFISLVFSWVMGAVITVVLFKRGKWARQAKVGGKIVDIS